MRNRACPVATGISVALSRAPADVAQDMSQATPSMPRSFLVVHAGPKDHLFLPAGSFRYETSWAQGTAFVYRFIDALQNLECSNNVDRH